MSQNEIDAEVFNLIDEAVRGVGVFRFTNSRVHAANLLLRAARHFLRTMPYEDYLETEWWQERRKDAIEHAGGRCQLCDRTPDPGEVHHRTYVRRGFEFLADMVYLCVDCHAKFHDLFSGSGEAPPLCRICNAAMDPQDGLLATYWFCPTGHGPIFTQSHKQA